MTAVERWNHMVVEEHAQTDRLRDPAPSPSDHWHGMTDSFRMDPRRTDDPLLDALLARLQPHHTVIDVGAGAGRLALPIALRCASVAAVEPSQSMASALAEEASRHGITNITLLQDRWEDAPVPPADIVLCAHVLYTCRDIETFVRKLDAHATSEVWVVLFHRPPQRRIYPLWLPVHGEERLWLPALPEFEQVLHHLNIEYSVQGLTPQDVGGFESLDQAWSQLRGRLFLTEGSEKDRRLGQVLADELIEEQGQLRLKGASPLEPSLVSWRPISA